ncbi:MAG: hypothetical protein RBT81_12920, partial [Gammaproteobacteria bacterium]|nr:hypothetical protein [Gammaproteobacteria bacterium]
MADRKPWEEFSSTTSSDAPAEQKPWEAFGGEPKPEPKGFLGHARDSAIALGTGLAQGVQMLTNVAGADNAVSQGIGDAIDTMRGWESPERQSERAARAAKIKQAEESGSTWEEVKAYAGSFADAPLDTTLEALGTAAPTIAGAALTGGGSTAAQLAARAAPMALGAAQGVGAVKGEIHESVENRWKEAGASDEEAAARAAEAQSYAGENAGNIALGGALGVLAGSTGVESAVRRMAGSSLAREAAERAAPGVVRGALTGALYEAPMEALQGGQERYAANVAGQREGFDVPTWQGVAGQATLEGMASAPLGGGFGAANAYAAGRQRQDGADGQDAAGARGGDGPPSASPFDQAVPPPVLDADALERAGISQTPGAILDEQQLQRWGVDSLPPAADLPQIKPSEQMGLDPATGPMSAAAAMAVDSGASAQAPQAAQAVDPETGEVLQQQDAPGSEPATGIVGQLEAAQGPEQVRDILRRAEADDVVHALAGRPDLDQVAQSGLSEGAWNLLRDELSTARDLRARDRLAFVEQQARVNGGWDSLLANERNRLLNELGERRAASAGDASGAGQAAQAVDTAGSPAGEQRGGPGVAQSQATREAVDAVKQQTAEAIGQRLQGMKAGEVNTFAARILPTMGLKPTASKARNIALLTDGARVNLYGVAGELGVELSDASRSALEADMAGTVAEPIPATTDAASPVDVAPFRRALVDDSAGRTHDGYYMEVGPGYISLAEDATRVYPVMVDNGLERRSDSSGGAISRAYEQAVEIAQKLGKQFTSDSSVTVSAARVYESLKRKGYAVEKSQSARLATKPEVVSDRWMTDDGSPVFVVGPKGEGAQQQAGGSSNGVQSAAAAVPDNGAAQGGADVQRVAGDVVGVVDGGPASGAAVAAGVPVAGGQQAPTTQTAETPAARWQSMTPDQRQDALAAAGYVTAKGAPNVVATANKGREWDALGEKVRSRLTESMSGQGRAAQAQAADAAPATATTPTPQYSSGDRVVADRDVIEGDIVTTPDGRQWMARVKRGRSIPVVPFENGKPVVSADTSRSFDLDETEVTHTGTNVYGHGNQPKPDVQKAQSGAAQSAQQGALPEFKTAVEFEQWLDEQVTEDREQLNSRSGDDGVGKVVLNEGKWIVSYDSGMTGRQRAERNPTYDARLVYRLDDGRLVWWEVETGRVLEVTQDDSRLEMKVGKEHAPEREDMSPSYMEVEHDGQIYSLMLPDSASRVTAEQLEEELYTRDFPAQVNEMFRQRVRESKPDAQQAGPATASQADADTESAQQPAQAEAQDQPAESAMDAAATQKARIADSVEKLADSDDTPQFSRASAAQQAGPNDAEIRALVEQYAAEDGAPSAAEITEAVRQFR